jgi:hypothetical protein
MRRRIAAFGASVCKRKFVTMISRKLARETRLMAIAVCYFFATGMLRLGVVLQRSPRRIEAFVFFMFPRSENK